MMMSSIPETQQQEDNKGIMFDSQYQWVSLSPMNEKRDGCAAVALSDTEILVVGGHDGNTCLNSVLRYDISTDLWENLPYRMNEGRIGSAVARVDNKIYVVGGAQGPRDFATVEVLDLDDSPRQWRLIMGSTMHVGRYGCAAVAVDPFIYVIGGANSGGCLNSVEILDTRTETWSPGPPMTTKRDGCAAAVVGKFVMVVGGNNGILSLSTAEQLDVSQSNQRWILLNQPMKSTRMFPAAINVRDELVVIGGLKGSGALDSAESWKDSVWTTISAKLLPRFRCAAVMLGTDLVVVGGHALSSVECLMSPYRLFQHRLSHIKWWSLLDDDLPVALWPHILSRLGQKHWESEMFHLNKEWMVHYLVELKNRSL
jgi:hypothetical protein